MDVTDQRFPPRTPRWTSGSKLAVLTLILSLASAPAILPATPSEVAKWPELSERIDQLWTQSDQPYTPGGVAAVIYRGELIHLKGYGAANREFNVAWTPDTRYRIASVTKSFVAYAVLLLQERGLLNVNDPVQKYLPDFPVFDAPLRLDHLLTMTSGLWQDAVILALTDSRGRVTVDEAYALIKRQRRLHYAPGSAASYIDTNYLLLARVISAVTGHSFWDAMDGLVFDPLGMTSTLAAPELTLYVDGQAPTYLQTTKGASLILAPPFQTSGDGSIITTMRDMVKWLQHLRSVEGASIFRQMIEPFELADGTSAQYRRGIERLYHRDLVGWGHGGVTGTHYVVWPQIDLIVANFTNHLDEVVSIRMSLDMTDRVLEALPDLSSKIPPPPVADAIPKLEELGPRDVEVLSGTFVETDNCYVLSVEPRERNRVIARFLGAGLAMAKVSSGHYVPHPFTWQSRVDVRVAAGAHGDENYGLPDLLVRHADWPTPRRFTRVLPMRHSDVRPQDYTGPYYSEMLGVHYMVEQRGRDLVLRLGGGVQAGQLLKMEPLTSECFLARAEPSDGLDFFDPGPISVRFSRDPEGKVAGMRVTADKARDLDFRRETHPYNVQAKAAPKRFNLSRACAEEAPEARLGAPAVPGALSTRPRPPAAPPPGS